MHKDSFWDNAAKSLPAPVRDRYTAYFEVAKRWELAWDTAFEAWLGIKALITEGLHGSPRARKQHWKAQ